MFGTFLRPVSECKAMAHILAWIMHLTSRLLRHPAHSFLQTTRQISHSHRHTCRLRLLASRVRLLRLRAPITTSLFLGTIFHGAEPSYPPNTHLTRTYLHTDLLLIIECSIPYDLFTFTFTLNISLEKYGFFLSSAGLSSYK